MNASLDPDYWTRIEVALAMRRTAQERAGFVPPLVAEPHWPIELRLR